MLCTFSVLSLYLSLKFTDYTSLVSPFTLSYIKFSFYVFFYCISLHHQLALIIVVIVQSYYLFSTYITLSIRHERHCKFNSVKIELISILIS